MNKNTNKSNRKKFHIKPEQNDSPGYEPYPPNEDIYSKFKEEEIDPEELEENSPLIGKIEPVNRKINPIKEAEELDVPGSELDDDLEAAGSEDEENNYYSLGGENHEDLEEDKGD